MAAWQVFTVSRRSKIHVPPCFRPEVEERDFDKWFGKYHPDVIVSHDRRIFRWVEERGLRCPDDVGVARLSIGGDETFYSGVYENNPIIGATAVDILVGLLQRGQFGVPRFPTRTLVEGEWRENKTVRRQG